MGRLRLKEEKSSAQVRNWRQRNHSSGGPPINKLLSESTRVSNSNGKEGPNQGTFWSLYSQSYPTCNLDPLRQRWKPLPVVNVSEVWVPQPAADMQLPSSKNKTPEISHIILLELWTHISISSPEIHSRKRRRFKEDGKEERNCKYSRQQITNERKLKGKGRLNKERSFRHKDNKRRK